MAFCWIIVFGLLGSGLASTEKIVTGKMNEMPGTSEPDGSDDDFYRQLARKVMDAIKSSRMADEPLVGQNEFELVLSGKRRRRFPVGFPHDRFKRVKRSFVAPPCAVTDEGNLTAGKNEFESGTTPKEWLRDPWDEVREFPEDDEDEDLPVGCMSDKIIHELEAFIAQNHTERSKNGIGRIPRPPPRTGPPRIPNKKRGKKKEKKKEVDRPENFIEIYKSKRRTGCGCSTTKKSIGCACCVRLGKWNLMICAGCGYLLEEAVFIVRITVEDFTLFSWEKKIAKSSFKKYLAIFSKSLCIPHKFAAIINACLKLSINFHPSFNKKKPSIIAACPQLVAEVFFFWDVVLLELPCWELEFNLPFLRITGEPPMAKLTFENHAMKLDQPVKKMFASEDIAEITKLIQHIGNIEKNSSHPVSNRAGSRMIQNSGEEPRLLKRGTPTVPINWSPTEMSSLRYLVVLYTQPLASPLTKEDLSDDAVKDVPGFHSMTLDGMDRRLPHFDPSIVNLRVHASMAHSCGGVILTKDKILTLCACIKFFYLFHKYKRRLQPEDRLDIFALIAKDIYVTYADRSFTANQIIYELVQNPQFFMKKSKCFDAIERSFKKTIKDATFTDTHMHSVVMTVTRDFKTFENLTLIPWLDRGGARSAPIQAEMTAIGMRKSQVFDIFDAHGWEYDSLYEVVKVPFVSCQKTRFCRQLIDPTGNVSVSKEFDERTECFCAKEPGFQLCDGVVGFPVTTSQGLIGLNAIPMHCKEEGSVAAAMFTEDSIKEIRDYLNAPDPGITESLHGMPSRPTIPDSNTVIPSSGLAVAASMSMTIVSLLVFIDK